MSDSRSSRDWTEAELNAIDAPDEVRIATLRGDGSKRAPVVIWLVRVGGSLFIRAVKGIDGPWYRGAISTHRGTLLVEGRTWEVAFETAGQELATEIDTAYRTKYGRYSAATVNSVLSSGAQAATLQLLPFS